MSQDATSQSILKLRRLPSLDGLRAAAILMVLLVHMETYLDEQVAGVKAAFETGWNGVFLFFVLSGFLVGSLAFKEIQTTGKLALGRFWVRRFLRTWPLYFLLLALNYWRTPTDLSPDIWHYLTFTQNFYEMNFFVPSWSLAVEEQFYFFFPVLLVGLLKIKKVQYFPLVAFLGIGIAYWVRYSAYEIYSPLSVMDCFWIGLLFSFLKFFHPEWLKQLSRWPNALFLSGLAFVYLPLSFYKWSMEGRLFIYGGQAIGFGMILLAALNPRLWCYRLLASKAAFYLALISYSVYASHNRIIYHVGALAKEMQLTGWATLGFILPLFILGSILFGVVLYLAIEKPGMAFREKYFPRARVGVREQIIWQNRLSLVPQRVS